VSEGDAALQIDQMQPEPKTGDASARFRFEGSCCKHAGQLVRIRMTAKTKRCNSKIELPASRPIDQCSNPEEERIRPQKAARASFKSLEQISIFLKNAEPNSSFLKRSFQKVLGAKSKI
jgi:hypothetical protein